MALADHALVQESLWMTTSLISIRGGVPFLLSCTESGTHLKTWSLPQANDRGPQRRASLRTDVSARAGRRAQDEAALAPHPLARGRFA